MTNDLISRAAALDALDKHSHGTKILGGQTYRSITLEVAFEAIRALPAVALGEPETVRYGFDGYGWKYMDAGSGSDWLKRAMAESDAEPLYDNPASQPADPAIETQPDPRAAAIAQLVGALEAAEELYQVGLLGASPELIAAALAAAKQLNSEVLK